MGPMTKAPCRPEVIVWFFPDGLLAGVHYHWPRAVLPGCLQLVLGLMDGHRRDGR